MEFARLHRSPYEQIKESILTGAYSPGTILTEVVLAEQLGVSRTPIRESLVKLTQEGLLRRFPGKGVVVPELTVKELISSFEVQEALERYALEKLIREEVPLDPAELYGFIHRQRASLAAHDHWNFLQEDRGMHSYILGRTENVYFTKVMMQMSNIILSGGFRAVRQQANMADVIEEHVRLVEALLSHDLEEALHASRAHITAARSRLMVL